MGQGEWRRRNVSNVLSALNASNFLDKANFGQLF